MPNVTDQARVALYAQAVDMQGVTAAKFLRQHLGVSLVDALALAQHIARSAPDSTLAQSLKPYAGPNPPRENEAILTELEKVIASACFPSNPDMSGDPRRKLGSFQLRRVEECAISVLDVFVQAGFRPSPAPTEEG